MARYSDKRDHNIEVKHLHKVWSKVDSRIELPQSLTGDSLLHLLNDIPEPKRKQKPERRKIRFSPQVFSWRSGLTYAAALVLIVALASQLGRGNPDLQEGVIEPVALPGATQQLQEAEPRAFAAEPEAEAAPDAATDTTPMPEVSTPVDPSGQQAVQPGDGADAEPFDPATAMGGSNESILLGQDEQYTYTYRSNDETDPDKAGFPVTVNVTHTNTGVLAFEIDIAEITTVDRFYSYDSTLTVLGSSQQDGVEMLTYDLTRIGEPLQLAGHVQAGALLDARLYKNVLAVLTYAPAGTDPGCDVTPLPDSIGEDFCIVSTMDLDDPAQMRMEAFSGAGEEVMLSNLNAYLTYDGEATEENEAGRHTAHIRLDGMDIELRTEPAEAETSEESN